MKRTLHGMLVLAAVLLGGLVILAAGAFLGLGLRETPKGAAGTLLASAIELTGLFGLGFQLLADPPFVLIAAR